MHITRRTIISSLCLASQLLLSSCGQEEQPLYPYGGPSIESIDQIGNPYPDAKAFRNILETVYCDPADCSQWIRATSKGLSFSGRTIMWNTPPQLQGKAWRKASEMPPMTSTAKPLAGVRIGIDAGHIGGKWARMEYRDNIIGGKYRVIEGNSTQITATHLAKQLRALGAEVLLVREGAVPVSRLNPDIIARRLAKARGVDVTPELVKEARQWFVRRAEINARAAKLKQFRPDLTVCLHFDAGSPVNPIDRLHLIVNGSYTKTELADPELRQAMISKILGRVYDEEVPLSSAVASSMASTLNLQAFSYGQKTERVRPVEGQPFLWCRNLLANCLYPGPVVYTEPYAMNNVITARRMTAGDYEGTQTFSGKKYRSIYREYAEAVAEGIKNHYLAQRPRK